MKSSLLSFTLLLLSSSIFAQTPPISWGEIPVSELRVTEYPADQEAGAVVLFDFGDLKFDFTRSSTVFELDRHKRVKVLNRQGFSEGDVSIYFYSKDNMERITNLKVQVFSPDGTKTTLGRKDFHEEQINDYYSIIKFAVPQLEEGSVFEYKYTLVSENIFSLKPWYFQGDIPVSWSELRMEIPEMYRYVYLQQGNIQADEVTFESRRFGGNYNAFTAKVRKHRLVMENVPALREEAFITTMDDYYAKVEFQLGTVVHLNSRREEIISDWSLAGNELMEHGSFGEQFTRKRNFNNALEALALELPVIDDPTEKTHAIYNFLSERMNWNGLYSVYAKETLDDVYEQAIGSSAELNLLLVALLKREGLDAFPLLVSTREHGQMFEIYPIMSQFNHVFVGVLIGDEIVLLDLTQENGPAGLISVDALNGRALSLYNASAPIWVDIPTPESQSVYYGVSELSPDGVLRGTLKTSYEGYAAISLREDFESGSQLASAWTEALSVQYPTCNISDVSFDGLEGSSEKMTEEFHFDIENAAQVAGDYIYVNPILYSGFEENPFTREERLYPVDFNYTIKEKFIYNLQIPEGYQVAELPESLRAIMEGNSGLFQYTISDRGDNIQVRVEFELYKLRYSPEEFHVIKNFFDLVIEKLSEPVVLQRTLLNR